MSKIAIIGAGFGGMAAAWDLRACRPRRDHLRGRRLRRRAGQRLQGARLGLVGREVLPSLVFQSDKYMLGLIKELGWQDKVRLPAPAHGDVPQRQVLPVQFQSSRR